jgi:hypothetical protein
MIKVSRLLGRKLSDNNHRLLNIRSLGSISASRMESTYILSTSEGPMKLLSLKPASIRLIGKSISLPKPSVLFCPLCPSYLPCLLFFHRLSVNPVNRPLLEHSLPSSNIPTIRASTPLDRPFWLSSLIYPGSLSDRFSSASKTVFISTQSPSGIISS